MKIVKGVHEGQLRCLGPEDMMVGLITWEPDGKWRVEMFMSIDAKCESEKEAVAFALGCWAAVEATRTAQKAAASQHNFMEVVKGFQNARTKGPKA